ncbi:aminodeoxychorismate synthase component I [Winogradskyella maritima]|uniref:Aminodeoxychorismate synthase component I n=1 Tax=Winogradskyella maritima TaxID=1517766 RepID=A0ABV8AI97_9FLAO|nr:aminodeoxychorismate synthase component I [Winogradskyella maritima]
MRTSRTYSLANLKTLKSQLLQWAQSYDDIVWLDSNNHDDKYVSYEAILAVDALTAIRCDFSDAFARLKEFQESTNDWIFGYLTYDLKNDIEDLTSSNFDGLKFSDLYFFQPKKLILISKEHIEFRYMNAVSDEVEMDFNAIQTIETLKFETQNDPIKIKLRTSKDSYFEKVGRVLKHIHRGDVYETNFCMECYAENVTLQPCDIFENLNTISKPPFATFLKMEDKYIMSASPERFIKKMGSKVISQPIKGTAPRSKDGEEDKRLKIELQNDPKERSENIMIVDLVRNDLSQTAEKGSVKVEELCGVYSFLQVHQMISTISSHAKPEFSPVDIIKSMFPMGSMTGAPKISAMQIIEDLEDAKRGVYSGSVGYIDPDGNFDFNVIIRSILYNQSLKYVSYSVGSAITAKSDPLKEYEECLTKAKAMRTVLES